MRGFAHLSFLPFQASKSWEETFEYAGSATHHSGTKNSSEHPSTKHSSPKYFIGHFVNLSDYKNYGIKATLSPTPPPLSHNIHSCLLEHPIYYDLTLQDYTTNHRWILKWVGWWGGDAGWMSSDPNCSANGDRIRTDEECEENISKGEGRKFERYVWFRTNRLKANEEAQKHIEKFLPKLDLDKEDLESVHVCLGEMEVVVEDKHKVNKEFFDHDREDELHEKNETDDINERRQIEESDEECDGDDKEMILFDEKELEKICDKFIDSAR